MGYLFRKSDQTDPDESAPGQPADQPAEWPPEDPSDPLPHPDPIPVSDV